MADSRLGSEFCFPGSTVLTRADVDLRDPSLGGQSARSLPAAEEGQLQRREAPLGTQGARWDCIGEQNPGAAEGGGRMVG